MNQTKRIVIIEGDAFDADAIVAIAKFTRKPSLGVWIHGQEDAPFESEYVDNATRDAAFTVAVDAWRKAVGDLPVVDAIPPTPSDRSPDQPAPEPTYWSDEKGRYFESYSGHPIYLSPITGERLIWNAGPPGRANVVGPEASPITKIYVDQEGKPI